ncbi:MAG: phosphoribosylformylglycinamidine synthase subunit PurS [Bacteroidales bacterium]|jgi:phosphoribosylformylglycinamidine synthase
MKFTADINVMPLKNLLDPQGKAVTNSIHNMGYKEVANVRIGKHMTLEIDANTEEEAMARVNELCSKILSNPVMEGYEYTIKAAE